MTTKLVIDNTKKYVDEPINVEFPFMVNDHQDEVSAMFHTWKEAALYQIGMGIRASTTIEIWEN